MHGYWPLHWTMRSKDSEHPALEESEDDLDLYQHGNVTMHHEMCHS